VLGFGAETDRMRDTTGDIGTSDLDEDQVDEVDAARSREYALLSTLLARAPDRPLIERLADLRADASPLGRAHAAVAEAAGRSSAVHVQREYFDLFIGLGRGELLPYGSYYLTWLPA
jgi:TorA maturation chaperone TorD